MLSGVKVSAAAVQAAEALLHGAQASGAGRGAARAPGQPFFG